MELKLSNLGILPRLGLALTPWAAGEIVDIWFTGCFFSTSPFCIYVFHPPVMDVLFALVVLAPFISTPRLVPLRVLSLILLSIFVHAAAPVLLVGTRGSIDLPGVDSIFVNILPIAIAASVITALFTVLVSGRKAGWRLIAYSVAAGLPVTVAFLLADQDPAPQWLSMSMHWHWAIWHLSVCAAIYYGIRHRNSSDGTGGEAIGPASA